jgi:hypothetical protein
MERPELMQQPELMQRPELMERPELIDPTIGIDRAPIREPLGPR